MTNAARVWFILQYFGVKAVILNGGWPLLSSATGLPAGGGRSEDGFRAVPGAGSVGLIDRGTLKRQLDGDAHVSTPVRARGGKRQSRYYADRFPRCGSTRPHAPRICPPDATTRPKVLRHRHPLRRCRHCLILILTPSPPSNRHAVTAAIDMQ